MANAQRGFTVIQGGTGGGAQRTYIDTGVIDEHGHKVLRPGDANSGNGGGGDMTPLWKLDIHRDVQLAKWGVVTLGGAMLGMLWFLLSQIDSRFDRADDKITGVAEQVSDLRVEIAGQRGDIKSLLEKLDDNAQASNQAGQAGPVRQGP